MSRLEKDIQRLKSKPKNYTYEEAKRLLNKLGFLENNKGRTSGSRVEFKDDGGRKIILHKPHPNSTLKIYQINIILNDLEEMEVI